MIWRRAADGNAMLFPELMNSFSPEISSVVKCHAAFDYRAVTSRRGDVTASIRETNRYGAVSAATPLLPNMQINFRTVAAAAAAEEEEEEEGEGEALNVAPNNLGENGGK